MCEGGCQTGGGRQFGGVVGATVLRLSVRLDALQYRHFVVCLPSSMSRGAPQFLHSRSMVGAYRSGRRNRSFIAGGQPVGPRNGNVCGLFAHSV